jgi:hypothetical protein
LWPSQNSVRTRLDHRRTLPERHLSGLSPQAEDLDCVACGE